MTRERVLLDYVHPKGPMICDVGPGVSAVWVPVDAVDAPEAIRGTRFVRTGKVDSDAGFPVFVMQREPKKKK